MAPQKPKKQKSKSQAENSAKTATTNVKQDFDNKPRGDPKLNGEDGPVTNVDIPSETQMSHTISTLEEAKSTTGANSSDGSPSNQDIIVRLLAENERLSVENAALRVAKSEISESPNMEVADVLAKVKSERDHFETSYNNLLGKIGGIKSALGEKFKELSEELAQMRAENVDLQKGNSKYKEDIVVAEAKNADLVMQIAHLNTELSNLRSRLNLSQQNWLREKGELEAAHHATKLECKSLSQESQEWQVLALEERSNRNLLSQRIAESEEQYALRLEDVQRLSQQEEHSKSTITTLRHALQELQEARKLELREVVDEMQASIDGLKSQNESITQLRVSAENSLQSASAELERVAPFEKEAKEKNLLILKLRHEAVVLNEHLTKALKAIKRDREADTVDKTLIGNLFLSFLGFQRGDARKYETLQLIARFLGWTDEQRERAGLQRVGSNTSMEESSISPSLSPFRRTVSSASRVDLDGSRESLAELWTSFLDTESARGSSSTV